MASKRRLRRRSCANKKAYTEDKAYDALRAQYASGTYKAGQYYAVYKCKFCNKYHIGRPDKQTKQKLNRQKR